MCESYQNFPSYREHETTLNAFFPKYLNNHQYKTGLDLSDNFKQLHFYWITGLGLN